MSVLNLRKSPWISNLEMDELNFDEYLFCRECRDYVYEYCSIHGPLLVVPDDKIPSSTNYPSHVPRAALTIPSAFLHLAPSSIPGAGIGVFSTSSLPVGVRFGPYRGQITKDIDSEYCWRIYSKNNIILRAVDAADDEQSNWMRYVNCSRHWCEQNLIAYQYKGQVYYRVIKIIPRFTELLVFYGSEFANVLNVDLRLYNSPQFYHGNEYNEFSEKELKKSNTNSFLSNTIHIQLEDNVFKNNVAFDENDILLVNKITETNKNPAEIFVQSNDIKKNGISKEFECNRCGELFSTKNILSEHTHKCIKTIQTFEHDMQLTQADLSKLLLQKYSCDICPFETNQKRYIVSHLKMHNTDKIFICDICQYRCVRRYRFDRHVRSHSAKKPLSCDTCQYKCDDRGDLKHPLGTHRREELHCCAKCQYSTVKKSNAYACIRSYSCNICPYRSIKKDSLKRHMRTHTGEKPYACDICSFRSARKSGLNNHMIVHTGKKPYACEVCLFRSARKYDLTRHMRVHAGKTPKLAKLVSTPAQNVII